MTPPLCYVKVGTHNKISVAMLLAQRMRALFAEAEFASIPKR